MAPLLYARGGGGNGGYNNNNNNNNNSNNYNNPVAQLYNDHGVIVPAFQFWALSGPVFKPFKFFDLGAAVGDPLARQRGLRIVIICVITTSIALVLVLLRFLFRWLTSGITRILAADGWTLVIAWLLLVGRDLSLYHAVLAGYGSVGAKSLTIWAMSDISYYRLLTYTFSASAVAFAKISFCLSITGMFVNRPGVWWSIWGIITSVALFQFVVVLLPFSFCSPSSIIWSPWTEGGCMGDRDGWYLSQTNFYVFASLYSGIIDVILSVPLALMALQYLQLTGVELGGLCVAMLIGLLAAASAFYNAHYMLQPEGFGFSESGITHTPFIFAEAPLLVIASSIPFLRIRNARDQLFSLGKLIPTFRLGPPPFGGPRRSNTRRKETTSIYRRNSRRAIDSWSNSDDAEKSLNEKTTEGDTPSLKSGGGGALTRRTTITFEDKKSLATTTTTIAQVVDSLPSSPRTVRTRDIPQPALPPMPPPPPQYQVTTSVAVPSTTTPTHESGFGLATASKIGHVKQPLSIATGIAASAATVLSASTAPVVAAAAIPPTITLLPPVAHGALSSSGVTSVSPASSLHPSLSPIANSAATSLPQRASIGPAAFVIPASAAVAASSQQSQQQQKHRSTAARLTATFSRHMKRHSAPVGKPMPPTWDASSTAWTQAEDGEDVKRPRAVTIGEFVESGARIVVMKVHEDDDVELGQRHRGSLEAHPRLVEVEEEENFKEKTAVDVTRLQDEEYYHHDNDSKDHNHDNMMVMMRPQPVVLVTHVDTEMNQAMDEKEVHSNIDTIEDGGGEKHGLTKTVDGDGIDKFHEYDYGYGINANDSIPGRSHYNGTSNLLIGGAGTHETVDTNGILQPMLETALGMPPITVNHASTFLLRDTQQQQQQQAQLGTTSFIEHGVTSNCSHGRDASNSSYNSIANLNLDLPNAQAAATTHSISALASESRLAFDFGFDDAKSELARAAHCGVENEGGDEFERDMESKGDMANARNSSLLPS